MRNSQKLFYDGLFDSIFISVFETVMEPATVAVNSNSFSSGFAVFCRNVLHYHHIYV